MGRLIQQVLLILLSWLPQFISLSLFAQESSFLPPQEIVGQEWRIHSLLEQGNLKNQFLMFLEFEKDGTAWIASSNGLLKYDGYTWKNYTIADGLPSSFVRCALITSKGVMWVGTDKGVGVFDGNTFRRMGSENGLSSQNIRRIREDSSGTIWFCGDAWPNPADPGGLTSFQDGQWTQHPVQNGLPTNRILDFFEDSQGRQFVITFRGLAQRIGDRWTCPLVDQNLPLANDRVWSIVESPDYGVVASNARYIYTLKNNQWTCFANQFPQNYKLCAARDGKIVTCGEFGGYKRFFLEWNGADFQPVAAEIKAPIREISQVCEAPDGSIWCIGFDSLRRWERKGGQWSEYAHAPAPALVDNHNRVWFANPQTTLRWSDGLWESMKNPQPNLAVDKKGTVWGWSSQGFTEWAGDAAILHASKETHLNIPFVCKPDAEGNLFFYGINEIGRFALVLYEGSQWIERISFDSPQRISIGSAPDPEKGVWCIVKTNESYELLYVNRDNLETYPIPLSIKLPIPVPMRVDREKNIWIYGDFGLYKSNQKSLGRWELVSSYAGQFFTTSAASNKDVWFGITAHLGNPGGLVQYAKGVFSFYPANPQSLSVVDKDQTIYFTGDDCLYRISDRDNRTPRQLPIHSFNVIHSIVRDHSDAIWIGQSDSVLRFRSDKVPPDTHIIVSASEVIAGRNLLVRFQGLERFSPDLPNDQFRFSWRFDDRPWTEFQNDPSHGLSLKNLSPGRHSLHVRAQDIGYDVDPTPASYEFVILPVPLQERVWFQPLVGCIIVFIVILACYALLAKHKIADHAQKLENLIADQKNSIQKREATLKSIFRSAPVGIGIIANRKIVWANEKLGKMLGYSSDEIVGKDTRWLYPSDDEYRRVGEEGYRELHTQGIKSIETQIKTNEGKIIDILLSLAPIDPLDLSLGVTFTALDISEKKQAAETLAENERIFREAIEVAGAVPYYLNFMTNVYEYVGTGIEEMIGYSPKEFTHELWDEITQEIILLGDLQGLTEEEAIQRARGAEGVSWRADYRVRIRSGEERWLANAAVQVRDEYRKVVGSLGILQDITERKKLEEHLRQAQKMEAIGQLAGGIAHNINNLLTGIIGNQSLALLKAAEDIRTYLQNSNNAALRAAELIKELLAFSRKTRLELVPLSLNDAVQEVFHLIRETFDRRIDIKLILANYLPPVLADASQIHSVLMNLCINARDAIENVMRDSASLNKTGDPFRILLKTSTQNIASGNVGPLTNNRPGKYAVVSVADNGSGIDAETQKHIFEPFFTTKDTVGTGLGLASSFGVIKQHNGWIDFSSQPGSGSIFRIYLPIIDKEITPLTTLPPSQMNLSGKETILLVDDEELILNLATEILEEQGYSVLTAMDGQECLNLYQKEKDRIDAIVLDLSMPRLSGNEVMKQIFSDNPHFKIIVSSGHANGFDSDALIEQGASGVISKPYKPHEFIQKIREVLDRGKPEKI